LKKASRLTTGKRISARKRRKEEDPVLAILDVGHGNAAVLSDTNGVIVIDTGKGGTIVDFLKSKKIKTVEVLIFSHADEDHIADGPTLLLDPEIIVKKVFYNSDAKKNTRIWTAFRSAIAYARKNKAASIEPQLTTTLSDGRLDRGRIHIEVLYPPPEVVSSGPGGRDLKGRKISSNSMCAAVSLVYRNERMVLLAGDIEESCVEYWKSENINTSSRILVFPHHGGNPGSGDPVDFAKNLCEIIKPQHVVFSIGRGVHSTPRKDIINAVRKHLPASLIACTQLSEHCAEKLVDSGLSVSTAVSKGRDKKHCCAGTIEVKFQDEGIVVLNTKQHGDFLNVSAPGALCRLKAT
jgi:beta-lactamase superfamily II metal-dependent hydrolase